MTSVSRMYFSAFHCVLFCGIFHNFALAFPALAFPASLLVARTSLLASIVLQSRTTIVSGSPVVSFGPSSTIPTPSSSSSLPRFYDASFTASLTEPSPSTVALMADATVTPSSPVAQETTLPSISSSAPPLVILPHHSTIKSKFIVETSSTGSSLLQPSPLIESLTLSSSSTVSILVPAQEDSTVLLSSLPTTSVLLITRSSGMSDSPSSLQLTLSEVSNLFSASPTASGGSILAIDPVLLLYIVIPPCCLIVIVVIGFGLYLCIRRYLRLRRLHTHLMPLRDMEGSDDSDEENGLDDDVTFTVPSSEHKRPVLRFQE